MPAFPISPLLARWSRRMLYVFATLAFVAAVMPSMPGGSMTVSDKALHAMTFFGLAVLAGAAFPTGRVLTLFLALLAFGGFIEAFQGISGWGRNAEWFDMASNIGGTVVGLAFVRLTTRPAELPAD